MSYWVHRPEPQPTQRPPRVPPSALVVGDQPPRSTNAQLLSLVGRQWPEDKFPYPTQIRRDYIAPQLLQYGNQPPRRTNAQLFNLVAGHWPRDKEPYPHQLWRLDIVPPTFIPAVNIPPPHSAVKMLSIVMQWPADKEPRLNPRISEGNIAPYILPPVVNAPPRKSNVQYLSLVTRQWPRDKEPRIEVYARKTLVFPGSWVAPIVEPDRLQQAIKEAYASAPAGVIVIHTLEFRHPNFRDELNNPAPIRVVLGHKNLEAKLEEDAPQHPGQYVVFIPMAFELELPNVEHLAMPEIGISIDNVSRDIEDNLTLAAASPYPVEVTYRPYLNTDLTQPQMNPPLTMTLISAEADDFRVTARATYGNAANVLCPREFYNEDRFPGIQR